jgi:hypothetical protein
MRCPACGAEVLEQAVFCHRCGERLEPKTKEETSTPAVQPASEAETRSAADLLQNTAANGDKNTEPEREIWRGGYSPKAMLGGWILSAAITIVLLLIGIFWFPRTAGYWLILMILMLSPWVYHAAILVYRRMSVRYVLTSQRFIHELGVLRRTTNRIEVLDMDDITFEQSVWERLVGVGTIRILSSDRTDPDLVLTGIDDVKHVAELFDDARRIERRRRGVHIEQI